LLVCTGGLGIEASTFRTKATNIALERRLLGMKGGEENNAMIQPATKSKFLNL